MKKLYVRVQPKQGAERFFRCGIEFRQAWKEVEVDAATAARLEAEQMLEVSEAKPAELENQTPNEADPSGHSTTDTDSGTPAAAPTTGDTAAKLNEALVGVLKRPDVVKTFAEQGMATAPRSAAEFGSFMTSEAERWSALVKSSGATVD